MFSNTLVPRVAVFVLVLFAVALVAQAQMAPPPPPATMNQTALLFPLVSTGSSGGNDTVITITNISMSPVSKGKSGTCALYFYGDNVPNPASVTTPSVSAGQVLSIDIAAGVATTTPALPAVQGFTGYVIANCNFRAQGVELFTTNSGLTPPTFTAISATVNP